MKQSSMLLKGKSASYEKQQIETSQSEPSSWSSENFLSHSRSNRETASVIIFFCDKCSSKVMHLRELTDEI